MIPREILKKIRQIELRTNRLVSEMLALPRNLEALSQGVWISARMVNSQNADVVSLYREVNLVFESTQECFAYSRGNLRKVLWMFLDTSKQILESSLKLACPPGLVFFIPGNGLAVIQIGRRLEIKPPHLQPKRSRTS